MANTSTKSCGVGRSSRKSTQTFQIFILTFSQHCSHSTVLPPHCIAMQSTQPHISSANYFCSPLISVRVLSEPNIRSVSTNCSGRTQPAERTAKFNIQTNTNAIKTTEIPRDSKIVIKFELLASCEQNDWISR